MVSAFGSLWVQSTTDGSLWRIGSDSEVQARIPGVFLTRGRLANLDQPMAAGFGSVWTLMGHSLVRIDPATNSPSARIEIPPFTASIATGQDAMWAACCTAAPPGTGSWPRLLRIDPVTNSASVVATTLTDPAGLGAGFGSVWWVNGSEAASVSRIDPVNGREMRIGLPVYAGFVVPTKRWLWLIGQGQVARLDPLNGSVSKGTVQRARQSFGVTYTDGTVWINDGDLVGFDAMTGRVTARESVNGPQDWQSVAGIAVLGPDVWLVDPADQRVVRVKQTVRRPSPTG
jgi:hypothetical protein